jgi:hypothetical protein
MTASIAMSLSLPQVGIVSLLSILFGRDIDLSNRRRRLNNYEPIPNTMDRDAFIDALRSDVFYQVVPKK